MVKSTITNSRKASLADEARATQLPMNEGLGYRPPIFSTLEQIEREGLRIVDRSTLKIHRRLTRFQPAIPSPSPGVTWDKAREKWQAYVGGGKTRRVKLGRFDTAAEAASVVAAYHKDH